MNGDIGYEVRVCGCFVERFTGPDALERADTKAQEIARELESTIRNGHAREAQFVLVEKVAEEVLADGSGSLWLYKGEEARYRGCAPFREDD